jgi:hypothetical protein
LRPGLQLAADYFTVNEAQWQLLQNWYVRDLSDPEEKKKKNEK